MILNFKVLMTWNFALEFCNFELGIPKVTGIAVDISI